jgi:hypothetical protein
MAVQEELVTGELWTGYTYRGPGRLDDGCLRKATKFAMSTLPGEWDKGRMEKEKTV